MRKFILCTLSFVTLSLLFTACNGNNPNDPLVGTWAHVEDYGDKRSEQKVTFDGRDNFTYSDFKYMSGQVHFGQITKGTYKINGDEVNIHYTGFSWTNDGEHMEEQTDFQPYDENFKYAISGNTLTIIRGDDTETYTKQ